MHPNAKPKLDVKCRDGKHMKTVHEILFLGYQETPNPNSQVEIQVDTHEKRMQTTTISHSPITVVLFFCFYTQQRQHHRRGGTPELQLQKRKPATPCQ